jgi:hypothetical protein
VPMCMITGRTDIAFGLRRPEINVRDRNSGRSSRRRAFEEEIMWQLHAMFRLGGYRTSEFDVTPALAITLIVAVVGLIIRTGL